MNKLPTLTDVVYNDIKNKIVNLEISPGTRLKQNDLCKHLGVSPTPVREALNRLEKEAWLEAIPRRGRFVRRVDYKEMREILDVRRALELLAVHEAVTHLTRQDIERMRNAIERIGKYMLEGDIRGNVEADIEFHEIICRASGNNTLVAMFLSLVHMGKAFIMDRRVFNGGNKEGAEIDMNKHLIILEALERGDGRLAEEEIKRHYDLDALLTEMEK